MSWLEVVYVAAGIALPAYYLPQMRKCYSDTTRLASFSMSKASTQLLLRVAMLPFVFGVGNLTMTCIVSLDFAGRLGEYGVALWSLRRQGVSWREVVERSFSLYWLGRGSARTAEPAAVSPDAGQHQLALPLGLHGADGIDGEQRPASLIMRAALHPLAHVELAKWTAHDRPAGSDAGSEPAQPSPAA
ncbi:hypothetical protein RA210_U10518 [Rubrivivax sp. A210]|uniref:hypothetical protein n=1 Tax=Rubrivivax sp. A210 TaxID=2772301 RepID=UPI00191A169A|nr:hypothetical protein [Rubrivivax sp. A210]CAD5366823.1 hypothetical protein RA210_U10518 [Rubrivivax sp. A210]